MQTGFATFATLVEKFPGSTYATEFDADLSIPTLTGFQCQGDVSICPTDAYGSHVRTTGESKPVTKTGVEVIRGGAMNNAHTLRTLSEGVTFAPASTDSGVALGILTVPQGAEVFMEHPEHGFNGIGAGTFVIGRQREQADEIRMVAD